MVYYGRELYHYGIKGMKWGIRRTKEELNMDPEHRKIAYEKLIGGFFIAPNKVKIVGVTDHIINEDRKDRTQSPRDVVNAIRHPKNKTFPIKYNNEGQPSIIYKGSKATVAVNPEKGIIITAWPSSKKEKKNRLCQDLKKKN